MPNSPLPDSSAASARQSARRIAAIYVLVSGAWILFSDTLLVHLVQDPDLLSAGQTLKGWVFILLTGLMLFKLVENSLSARISTIEALQQSEAEFQAAFDQAATGMAKVGPEGQILTANKRLCAILGYTEGELVGLSSEALIHPAHRAEEQSRTGQLLRGEIRDFSMEARYVRKDGTAVWVHLYASPVPVGQGSIGELKVVEDIDGRKKSEEQLRLAAQALENTAEGVIITRGQRIISVNRAFSAITGYSAQEVVGTGARALIGQRAWLRQRWRQIREAGAWQGDIVGRRKNGEIFPAWASISTICDDEHWRPIFVTVFSDITVHKSYEERLHFLAHNDILTGLANRASFTQRIEEAILRVERHHMTLALLFIDLDRFKPINDALGHEYGDELLKQLTERISRSVRQTDALSRVGADEFGVLLENLRSPDEAARTASAVLQALAPAFTLKDRGNHYVSASIGVSCWQEDASSAEELLNHADIAMDRAKQEGGNRYRFFSAEMNRQLGEKLALANSLRLAIERGEFVLHYQPQVNLETGTLVGMEALLRWKHPERGLLLPSHFISLAEETGLIREIGVWVLREAVRQLRCWKDEGLTGCRVSVNLSARQLEEDQLPGKIKEAIQRAGLAPQDVELEITESALMNDPQRGESLLREFESLGIPLALDDFGTGYSSLAYLKRFPVSTLKIDKSFVDGVLEDENDIAITRAIIAMAKTLGLHVVAEGVETVGQQEFLAKNGCDCAQGYLLSHPLSASDMRSFMLSQAA